VNQAPRSQPLTLKDRIRADIESAIFSGKWPPGHRIPNEEELAESYSCSRMTVNQALSALAANGIVERRRKAGTFVGRPSIQSAALRIPEIGAEVEERGYTYRYERLMVERRKATHDDRDFMGLSAKEFLLEVRCRHWANQRPFAYERRCINLTSVPDAANQAFDLMPPGTWLLQHVPWTKAEHNISARDADNEVASSLQIKKGAACLVVQRRTWRSGDVITAVRTFFPGSSYQLHAPFTP
jgi:GntR family histidine utilization transcriptional repressor